MKATDARKIQRSLKDVFGLEKLRPGPREVIEQILSGRDLLAIMPTGETVREEYVKKKG